MGPVWKERRRIYLKPFLLITAFALIVSASALAALGHTAATGGIALRDLALTFQAAIAAINLGSHYPESDTQTQFGMMAYAGLLGFERGVEKYEGSTVQLEPVRDPKDLPKKELRFENVSFNYPGSERKVLNDFELSIAAGQSTAIVGLNGAGKTTLVKLLGPLRARLGLHLHRRDRHPPLPDRRLAPPDRHHLPGLQLLRAVGGRQHRLRLDPEHRRSRGDPQGGTQRRHPRGDRAAPEGLRHAAVAPVRGRRRSLWRPVAADRDRANSVCARGRGVDPGARRAHGRARRTRRGHVLRQLRRADPRRHHDPDLAPLLERAPSRADRRAPGRPRRRAGNARGAAGR